MEEWKEYKLEEVCKSIADGDHMPPPKSDKGIPFVTISNIVDNRLDFSNTHFVPQSYYDGLDDKRRPHVGDTIYSVVGTFGKPVYVKEEKPFVFQRHIAILRPDESKIVPQFLFYSLLSPQFYRKADVMAIGAVQRTISLTSLRNATIQLPSLEIQSKIVDMLSSLDAKIEVNRQINDNLEQQAQALYKSWFVDFEPFKNGEFVESELGMIPKGWRVGKLGEICKCILGGTPSRNKESYWNGNIPWINSGEVNEFRIIKPSEYITQEGLNHSATKLLPKKTTVLAITGATLGQVSLLEIDSCANQSVIGVLENETIPYEYIYPLVNDRINELCSHMTGGAQQHINKNNVEQLDVIIPQQDVMSLYKDKTKAIYTQIGNLCFESRHLAELRDTLLPKLMSGEIKVEDVTFTKKAMTIEK